MILLCMSGKQGETDHIATLTDTKILSLLKEKNEAGIDFINLSRLELHPSETVQIRWHITNQIELVDWKSVKLIGIPSETRTTSTHYLRQLREILKNKNQFVCFLSGAAGTGKSKVVNAMKHYCKLLCNELGVEFTKRTIVMS